MTTQTDTRSSEAHLLNCRHCDYTALIEPRLNIAGWWIVISGAVSQASDLTAAELQAEIRRAADCSRKLTDHRTAYNPHKHWRVSTLPQCCTHPPTRIARNKSCDYCDILLT